MLDVRVGVRVLMLLCYGVSMKLLDKETPEKKLVVVQFFINRIFKVE